VLAKLGDGLPGSATHDCTSHCLDGVLGSEIVGIKREERLAGGYSLGGVEGSGTILSGVLNLDIDMAKDH